MSMFDATPRFMLTAAAVNRSVVWTAGCETANSAASAAAVNVWRNSRGIKALLPLGRYKVRSGYARLNPALHCRWIARLSPSVLFPRGGGQCRFDALAVAHVDELGRLAD